MFIINTSDNSIYNIENFTSIHIASLCGDVETEYAIVACPQSSNNTIVLATYNTQHEAQKDFNKIMLKIFTKTESVSLSPNNVSKKEKSDE